MMKGTLATLVVSLVSAWMACLCVVLLTWICMPALICQFEHHDTLFLLPETTLFCLRYLPPKILILVCALASLGLIVVHVVNKSERKQYRTQVVFLALWHALMIVNLFALCLPLFKVGEVLQSTKPSIRASQQGAAQDDSHVAREH